MNLIMAHDYVGYECVKYLIIHHKDTIGMIVTLDENDIFKLAREHDIPTIIFNQDFHNTIQNKIFEFGFLIWWPHIIRDNLINIPKYGFVNTHPSLLPYNRGKHYSFWAIVEQNPFGVSLHFVDSSIDGGDIIAQKTIPYTWEDTGKTLYIKATKAIIELFQEQYSNILSFHFTRTPQTNLGSLHYAKEIDDATLIHLEQTYTARELLNLIRAKTFAPHRGCIFKDTINGGGIETYEVTIAIKKLPAKYNSMGRHGTRKSLSPNHKRK